MANIYLRDKDGLVRGFQISGDTPTATEAQRINAILTGTPAPDETPKGNVDPRGLGSLLSEGFQGGIQQSKAGLAYLAGQVAPHAAEGKLFGKTADDYAKMREEAKTETAKHLGPEGGFFDQEGLTGKAKYLTYQFGQSLPATLGGIGGAVVGSAVGPGGTVGGFLAGSGLAGAASYPQILEQHLEDQEQKFGTVKDPAKAMWSAAGSAALEGLADTATLKVGGLLKGAVPPGILSAAENATKSAIMKAGLRVGETAATGFVSEGLTEAVQQGIQRWQSERPLTDTEALNEYIENAVVGGIMGGVLGGTFGTVGGVNEYNANKKYNDIIKDLEETDKVGSFAAANDAKLKARAGAELAAEANLTTAPNAPLLEDLRPDRNLLSGPKTVMKEGVTENPVGDDLVVDRGAGVPANRTSASLFSEDEYSAATVAMRGETLISPDKIKSKLKVGRKKAQAIFDAMLERTDASKAGSKGQYLTLIEGETVKDVARDNPSDKITRSYETRQIPDAEVAPYEVRIQGGRKLGPDFKDAQEAHRFAESHKLGDYVVAEKPTPATYGVYETISGIPGQKPVSKLVKAFPTDAEAKAHLNSLNPNISPETNEKRKNQLEAQRVAQKQKEILGRHQQGLQKLADTMLGKGRSVVDLVRAIQGPGVVEGRAGPIVNGLRRVQVAYGVFDPNMTEEQFNKALEGVGHHEFTHVARSAGLFTPAEWNTLVRRANTRVAGRSYTYMERAMVRNRHMKLTPDQLNEEAVAEMVRDYMRDPTKFENAPRSLLRKIMDFVRSFGNYSKYISEGNDVIKDFTSGKMAERSGNTKEERDHQWFSSVPLQGFYYKASKYFKDIEKKNPKEINTPDNWINRLKNAGLKPEEIQWLGIEDWLRSQEGKVPVSDIIDYIAANGLDIQEEAQTGISDEERVLMDDARITLQDEFRRRWNLSSLDSISIWRVFNLADEIAGHQGFDYDDRPELVRAAETFQTLYKKDKTSTHHHAITQTGGEEYTELTISMPQLPTGDFNVENHFGGKPNIISSARFKTRWFGGRKALAIEEIQSDLHQQGKKKGYMDAAYLAKRNELEGRLSQLLSQQAENDRRWRVMGQRPEVIAEYENEEFRLRALIADARDDLNDFRNRDETVPDAPMKTSWRMLAFKRLLRWAAENDHDVITWHGEPASVADTEKYGDLMQDQNDGGIYTMHDYNVTGVINGYLKMLTKDAKEVMKNIGFKQNEPKFVPARSEPMADLDLSEQVRKLVPDKINFLDYIEHMRELVDDPMALEIYDTMEQIVRNTRPSNFDPVTILAKVDLTPEDFMRDWQEMEDSVKAASPDGWGAAGDDNIMRLNLVRDKAGNPVYDRWELEITPEMKDVILNEGMSLFSSVMKSHTDRAMANENFRKWFSGSRIVNSDGEPMVVYHGTTQDFDQFRSGYARGDWGGGFYFTTHSADAAENYAGIGPDLLSKMIDETDEIINDGEYDPDVHDMIQIEGNDILTDVYNRHVKHLGGMIPAFLSIKNPFIMKMDGGTAMGLGGLQRLVDSFHNVREDYLNVDTEKLNKDLMYAFRTKAKDGALNSFDLFNAVVRSGGLMDALDPMTGAFAAREVFRKALQDMGFDGVIDHTAAVRFRGMPGLESNTRHIIAFKPEQVKSVFNNGDYSADPRFMYSSVAPQYSANAPMGNRVPQQPPLDKVAEIEWKTTYNNIAPFFAKLLGKTGLSEDRAEKIAEGTVFALQDVYQPLAKLIDRVRANGGAISNESDTYLRQQLMTGQIDRSITKNTKDLYNPLHKAVQNLTVTRRDVDDLLRRHPSITQIVDGVPVERSAVRNILNNYDNPKLALAELYLYAQHAIERNALMRERNENVAAQRPDQYDSGSGMSDFEANDVLSWFQSKPFGRQFNDLTNANSIRSLFRKLIKNTNEVRIKSGLIPDFRVMTDEGGRPFRLYEDYAPLRGYLEENPDNQDELTNQIARTGKRLNIAGKEDQNALGRRSEAANLIATAVLQNEEAIIRAGKNEVGKSFKRLIENNGTVAMQNGPGRVASKITDFAEIVPLTTTKPIYDRRTGKVRMSPHNVRRDPDMMIVKEGGKEVGIRIKDARLRQALIGNQLLGEGGARSLINGLLLLNRVLATMRTSLNPEFLFSNFLRDFQTAQLNLSEIDLKGLKRDIAKSVLPAIRGSYQGIRDNGGNSPWKQEFDEFADRGGKTAFMGVRNLDTTIERSLKALQEDPNGKLEKAKNAVQSVIGLIEAYNDAVENGVRVATYKHVRDKLLAASRNPNDPKEIDRIKNRAAFVAKNLTVNFNMGGSQKPLFNALYLFFNASMQGSAAMVNPLLRSAKMRKIWASVIVAGAAQDMLMAALSPVGEDGESEYDKIPDYVLQTNMIFWNPFAEKGYIKIPMPYLFNAVWNTGRVLSRTARGGYSVGEGMSSIFGTALESMNPWGSGGSFLNFVAPTVVDPLVDLSMNTDFKGTPIAPEKDPFSATDIPSQRYWNNTSGVYTTIADFMDKASGGDGVFAGATSFSPNQYQYVFEFLGGGAWGTVQRAFDFLAPQSVGGKGNLYEMGSGNVSMNDIPFVRRLTGNMTDREDLQAYIKNRDRVMAVKDALSQAKKAGDSERYQEIMQKYRDEYRMAVRLSRVEARRRKISALIKKIQASTTIPETEKRKRVDALRQEQAALVNNANAFMNQ